MNDKVPLQCIDEPRHYTEWLDSYDFSYINDWIFGGVVAFKPEAFKAVNGYSNQFWGWGGKASPKNLNFF